MRLDRLDANAHDNDLSAPISVLAENELWACTRLREKRRGGVVFSRLNPFDRSTNDGQPRSSPNTDGDQRSTTDLATRRSRFGAELRKLRPKSMMRCANSTEVEHQDPTSLETLRFQCTQFSAPFAPPKRSQWLYRAVLMCRMQPLRHAPVRAKLSNP